MRAATVGLVKSTDGGPDYGSGLVRAALELLEDSSRRFVDALRGSADRLVGIVATSGPSCNVAKAVRRAVKPEVVAYDERNALRPKFSDHFRQAGAVGLA